MNILIIRAGKERFLMLIFTLLGLYTSVTFAQENLSSDSLFGLARKVAFEKKDYPLAIQFCRIALSNNQINSFVTCNYLPVTTYYQ